MGGGGSDAGDAHELTDEGGDGHGEPAAGDDPQRWTGQAGASDPRPEDSCDRKADQGDGDD
jgi:hypothetical protein